MSTVNSTATATAVAQPLTLNALDKVYSSRGRESFHAVKAMDLAVEPGELIALLGPSGCGKTTTLRMIAGLETVTGGSIKIGDREISQLPPGKRNVGVGFESYALYPPLSVRENLAYGLKARKDPDAAARVQAIAERLEMTDLLDLRPAGLSSGQKQRVALARALVRNPPVLLLDEPLSHLDASARNRVRRELKVLQREFGYTTIVVTHDQVEALSLADRLAVMNAGVIQQFGTPDEVFDDPANLFVATFVGEPQINLIDGTLTGDGAVRLGTGTLPITIADSTADRPVTVGIRPADAVLSPAGAADGLPITVRFYEHLMEFGLATVEIPGSDARTIIQTPAAQRLRPDDSLVLTAPQDRIYLFDPDSGDRIR